jgi:hypothetical protein
MEPDNTRTRGRPKNSTNAADTAKPKQGSGKPGIQQQSILTGVVKDAGKGRAYSLSSRVHDYSRRVEKLQALVAALPEIPDETSIELERTISEELRRFRHIDSDMDLKNSSSDLFSHLSVERRLHGPLTVPMALHETVDMKEGYTPVLETDDYTEAVSKVDSKGELEQRGSCGAGLCLMRSLESDQCLNELSSNDSTGSSFWTDDLDSDTDTHFRSAEPTLWLTAAALKLLDKFQFQTRSRDIRGHTAGETSTTETTIPILHVTTGSGGSVISSGKRPASNDQENDGENNGDGRRLRKKVNACVDEEKKLLACPFYKNNPRKYRRCVKHILRETYRVK